MRKGCLVASAVVAAAVVFGSLYGAYRLVTVYWDFGIAASQLPAAEKEYRATGLPWVAADIAPPRLQPAQDATPAIRAAIKALPDRKTQADLTKMARAMGAEADPVVAKFGKSLSLIESAASRPKVDFRRNWDLGPYILFPEYASMKALARAATVRAVRHATKGDDVAALADLALARRLALWAGEEPTLISMLVRIANEAIFLDGMQRCLAAARGKEARIARYRAWLRTLPPLPSFGEALRGEAWMGVSTARNLTRFGGEKALASERAVPVNPSRLLKDGFPKGTRERAMMTRVLQVWTEAYGETKGFRAPPMEIGTRFTAIQDRWSEKKGLSRTLVMILFPGLDQAGKAVVNLGAKRAVTEALADALTTEARTGQWPSSVSQIDPFTGKPLHVKRSAEGFRVYSVGRDLKDDGGLHRREAPKVEGATSDEVAAYPPVVAPEPSPQRKG